ncbi:MAG: EthD domain-containing protein [Actinomycetota bacterium]|nr:EthD domain-containing protein [Actinomycetota bacterium]
MEKLDYLLWDAVPFVDSLAGLARSVAVSPAAATVKATLLMGKGPELAGLVEVWVDSLDTRAAIEATFPGRYDGYLVTESVPQLPVVREGLLTHLSWFPKPSRLSDEEFYRGWQEGHTPTTAALHPRRIGYVRDAVARVLTPGSPPVRAIVSEYFECADYEDPRRLFGSKEAVGAAMTELPSYGDAAEMSCRPLWKGLAT